MFEIKGKYSKAKIFTDIIEEEAISQIYQMCNHSIFQDASICIMPDCHSGAGCTIGTTILMNKKAIIPNIVGVDVGCLDKDTEFLTLNGWKKISEWNNDLVLQYDKNTDIATFVIPQNYIVKPCEEFYHLSTKYGLDQAISEEHKILAWIGTKGRGHTMKDFQAKDFIEHHNSLKKVFLVVLKQHLI